MPQVSKCPILENIIELRYFADMAYTNQQRPNSIMVKIESIEDNYLEIIIGAMICFCYIP